MKNQIQVFLCHASEDKGAALKVYQRLKQERFRPWIDKEDLLPGQRWDQEIPKAIRSSDFILIFFSKSSVSKKGYVQKEFRLALEVYEETPEGEIVVIPVRIDDCEIPDGFRLIHYVDLFEEGGYERIVKGIKSAHEPAWPLDFSKDFADILECFAAAGEGAHRARDILNITQYTVWKKLMHWGVMESPKKGYGSISPRGHQFLKGKMDLPVRLYIRKNKIVNKSRETVSIKDYNPDNS